MRIVAISDVHGEWSKIDFPPGDILVLAGDLLPDDFSMHAGRNADYQLPKLESLNHFVGQLPYKHVLMIGGNHDWCLDIRKEQSRALMTRIKYLEDSGITIDGVRFYGSPWVPNLDGMAFFMPTAGRKDKWAAIPVETDVLITHAPPHGILDWHPKYEYLGCTALSHRLTEIKPQAHIFGHIHCAYGKREVGGIRYFNCAMMDEGYVPTNPPHVFDVNPK